MEQIEVFAASGVLVGANQHFFRAAATGNQANTGFHQADVGFGCRLNPWGVQAHFAAPAKSQSLRRGDDRLWRVFDRQIDILELLDGHVQLIPLLLLSAHQNQHQVRADGKIHGLVGDDHGVEIRLQALQSLVQHGDQVRADGVHLGVKFAADHAVAEIDQAGAGITVDFAPPIF